MEVVRSNEEAEDEEIRDRHWAKHYLFDIICSLTGVA